MIINFVIGLPGSGKSRYLKDKDFVVDIFKSSCKIEATNLLRIC